MTPAVIISICALVFTVASFWWLQARRGRLSCFPVQTFSGYLQPDGVTLRIPLSIFNSGARARVVGDLRMRLQTRDGDEFSMFFKTLRSTVGPGSDDVKDFAHSYGVGARSVDTRMVEFSSLSGPTASLLSGQPVTAVVDALVDHGPKWVELGRFPLHIEVMAEPGRYVTYTNQEAAWPPGLRDEAAVAFAKLRQQAGLQRPEP